MPCHAMPGVCTCTHHSLCTVHTPSPSPSPSHLSQTGRQTDRQTGKKSYDGLKACMSACLSVCLYMPHVSPFFDHFGGCGAALPSPPLRALHESCPSLCLGLTHRAKPTTAMPHTCQTKRGRADIRGTKSTCAPPYHHLS